MGPPVNAGLSLNIYTYSLYLQCTGDLIKQNLERSRHRNTIKCKQVLMEIEISSLRIILQFYAVLVLVLMVHLFFSRLLSRFGY